MELKVGQVVRGVFAGTFVIQSFESRGSGEGLVVQEIAPKGVQLLQTEPFWCKLDMIQPLSCDDRNPSRRIYGELVPE